MYYPIIRQCIQALKNLETWLDKAEQHAAAKGVDVGVLLTSRLAPDMKEFIYQVQSACDYTKGAAAWLSGQKPPRHEDSEQTIDEVRARIRKTVDFAESVKEAQYAGASERRVSLSWGHGKTIGVRTTYCRWSSRTSISTSPWPTPSSATTASTSAKGTFAVQSTGSTLNAHAAVSPRALAISRAPAIVDRNSSTFWSQKSNSMKRPGPIDTI